MKTLLYLSRSFVEFGPFSDQELLGFHQRGLLAETDYVRPETSEAWVPVAEWVISIKPVSTPVKKVAAKKKAATPAKKAAKKKA